MGMIDGRVEKRLRLQQTIGYTLAQTCLGHRKTQGDVASRIEGGAGSPTSA